MPEVESRLPVGSSANSTVGCEASARAMATRCCWPPESCDGLWPRRSPRPTRAISDVDRRLVGLAAGDRERQEDVLLRRQHRQQVERWKTKPMWRRRSLVSCLSGISVMSSPPIFTRPLRRAVEPGEQVHERRLARARRAHDGRELADGDLERDAAQRVHGRLALAVLAGDARGGRRRCRWPARAAVEVWVSIGGPFGWGRSGGAGRLRREARDGMGERAGGEQGVGRLGEEAAGDAPAVADGDGGVNLASRARWRRAS